MKFLSVLKTIGEDVEKGLAIAAQVVPAFVPAAGPVITEIENLFNRATAAGITLTQEQLSIVAQAIATVEGLKQAATAPTNTAAAAAAPGPVS